MDAHVYPAESVYAEQMEAFGENRWQVPAILEELKEKAKPKVFGICFCPKANAATG